jgi:hypothetical protein
MISAFPAASGSALLRVAIATALTLLMHGAGAQDRPAETKVRLVVGGKSAIFYLPLSVTERLGLKSSGSMRRLPMSRAAPVPCSR